MKFLILFIVLMFSLTVYAQTDQEVTSKFIKQMTEGIKGIKENELFLLFREESKTNADPKEEEGTILLNGKGYRTFAFWIAYFNAFENKDFYNSIEYNVNEFRFNDEKTAVYEPLRSKKYFLTCYNFDSLSFIPEYDFKSNSFNFDLIKTIAVYNQTQLITNKYDNSGINLETLILTNQLKVKIPSDKAKELKYSGDKIKNKRLCVLFKIDNIKIKEYDYYKLFGESNYISYHSKFKHMFLKPLKVTLTYTDEKGEPQKFTN